MAGVGHNSLAGDAADQLCGCVRRVEAIERKIKELNKQKSAVYSEVRAIGFHRRIVRRVVERRRMNQEEVAEADNLLAAYEELLTSTEPPRTK